ncbi:MAG: LPXTG cell wall anchor domain-containing protein [Acidimicrobiales bacterium]
MIWARRLAIGAGLAVASVVVVPGLAGAATNCPTTTAATVTPSGGGPVPTCPVVVPTVAGNSTTPATAAATASLPNTSGVAGTSTTASSSSSLPFTGADVDELGVIGGVALLAGGLLMWRRRTVRA